MPTNANQGAPQPLKKSMINFSTSNPIAPTINNPLSHSTIIANNANVNANLSADVGQGAFGRSHSLANFNLFNPSNIGFHSNSNSNGLGQTGLKNSGIMSGQQFSDIGNPNLPNLNIPSASINSNQINMTTSINHSGLPSASLASNPYSIHLI